MKIRENSLPADWYPRNSAEIKHFLSGFSAPTPCYAAIAPHAGWFYSGKIAAGAVSSLNKDVETVVVIGGHLPAGYPPLFALEDAVSTPFGNMAVDSEFLAVVMKETGGTEDRYKDNTVEVLLPMAHFYIASARLLWMRLPSEMLSFETGKIIASVAKKMGRKVAVLGSADLTHYGPNYGFTPQGEGAKALRWMEEVNDRRFIEAVESGNPAAVLERAEKDNSCCSAGAVLGAMGFADAMGLGTAGLLEYGTSAGSAITGSTDGTITEKSFVGYASFVFNKIDGGKA